MPGRDPHDHWDDEEEFARGYQDDDDNYPRDAADRRRGGRAPYYERGFGAAPRIGPTGMVSQSHAGSVGTSGSYYQDEQDRAAYVGFSGARPAYGPGPGRRPDRLRDTRSDPARRASYATERGYTREDEEAIGGPYTDYGRAFGGYGAGGGYTPTPEEGIGRERRTWDERSAPGSWFGRAPADSWADDRARRGEGPRVAEGQHRGRGPKGYTRSGERIREDVCDRLTEDAHLDASDIEVLVTGTEVTLDGAVDSRTAKRRAEDHADDVTGVTHVQNNLRVRPRPGTIVADSDPRLVAIAEGRDPEEAVRELREDRAESDRSAHPPR